MKLEQRLDPKQLAVLTIAGSLLLYASFWLSMRLPGHKPAGCECPSFNGILALLWLARFYFIGWFAPLVLGAWAMYGGLAAFKRGINDELWDQPTRDKLLSQLKSPIWTWIASVLAAFGFAFILFVLFRELNQEFNSPYHKYAGMGGMIFFASSPLYCLGCIRRDLKPKSDPLTRPPIWNEIKPIQSTHWGQR